MLQKKLYGITLSILFLVVAGVCARLVDIEKVIPGVVLDIRYATTNNFTGKKVYPEARCFLQEEAAAALALVQEELKKSGYALKLYDGYRPFPVQQIFWEIWLSIASARGIEHPQCYVAHPVVDEHGNPIKGSKHNRGTAIDLTLIDLKTGQDVSMPSEFDDFSEKAHRNYNAMTSEAAKNCQLLETTMMKHGFEPEPSEWWHFNWNGWQKYPLMSVTFDVLDRK